MEERLPSEVEAELRGRPAVGDVEPVLVFLTVGEEGFPHVTLLSRAEVEPSRHGVMLALAGRTTPANLDRSGRGTLFVVSGDTAHSVDLRVVDRVSRDGMTGYRTRVVGHRADSLGIALSPLSFVVPPELPSIERWQVSESVLELLTRREA
jgi:hypothetical protein